MRCFGPMLMAFGLVCGLQLGQGSLAPLAAQTVQPVRVTLTNTVGEKINIYVANADGSAPRFVGAMEPGARNILPAQSGQMIIFARDRAPFQRYVTTNAGAQDVVVALAPAAELPAATPPSAPSKPASNPAVQATPAPEGFLWQFANSQDTPASASLVFGIPETDAVQVFASCRQGQAGVRMVLGSDTSSMAPGQPVQLTLRGQAFRRQYPGTIEAPTSNEGLTGFVVRLALNDPLWNAMGSEEQLSYGLQQMTNQLSLSGNAKPLAQFLGRCAQLASTKANEQQKPAATTASGGAKSCATLRGKRSKKGGARIKLTVVNRTKEYRAIYLIDPQGQSVSIGGLNAGDSIPLNTFDGYIYEFTDGPGNCIEMVVPTVKTTRIEVTVPSPGFGPE
jgi:hypothetical protein